MEELIIGGFDDQEYGVAAPLWQQQYWERQNRAKGLEGADPNRAKRGLSEADAILVERLGKGGLRELNQQVQSMIQDGEIL